VTPRRPLMVPEPSIARRELLERLATQIPPAVGQTPVLVGVDGPDGSGKTIFADELAAAIGRIDRPALRICLDDFHNTRQVRYRRGRHSPVGFWLDSYNYPRFLADVLDPLSRSGQPTYRAAAHDLETDVVLDPPWQRAPDRCVVVVDGLFLHRDGLADRWDWSVFLDVPFSVTASRMAARDGTSPDPDHPSMRRYVDAQQIYVTECRPAMRATIVIDNAVVDAPKVRGQ
jgi:uridine kinase